MGCQHVREFLLSSIEDGISYVESRINFLFMRVSIPVFLPLRTQVWYRSFFGPDGRATLTRRGMPKVYGSVVQELKDEMKRQRREDEFVGSKVFSHYRSVCTLRTLTVTFSRRLFIPPSRSSH